MSTQSAYSSTHPEVLSWWDELQSVYDAFRTDMKALRERLHLDDDAIAFYQDRGWLEIAGFAHGTVLGGLPMKWQRNGLVMPKQTSKVAKTFMAELRSMSRQLPNAPGMPEFVRYGATRYSMGTFKLDGTVWASWGCSHDVVEDYGVGADGDMWVRRKLSEFHAAREANEKP